MVCCMWVLCFKQKTAYEMRISDWSSDVCSSDLTGGVIEHLLELAVRGLEERPHLLSVGSSQCSGLAEVVDEEPVALLGRDPPGAGVGLAEVALVLEGRHVVAHGGRGHLHVGRLHDVRGPHRLGGVAVRSEERRVGKECVRKRSYRW